MFLFIILYPSHLSPIEYKLNNNKKIKTLNLIHLNNAFWMLSLILTSLVFFPPKNEGRLKFHPAFLPKFPGVSRICLALIFQSSSSSDSRSDSIFASSGKNPRLCDWHPSPTGHHNRVCSMLYGCVIQGVAALSPNLHCT